MIMLRACPARMWETVELALRTNARIVTGTGQTIDGGTIVMKDGLITAVGSNVNVPADAWTIDGTGMTVYPGLIDAMSNVAVPESMRRPAGGGGFGFGAGGPGGAACGAIR